MREDKCLEFKENIQSNTFLKTISAFANYGTGEIIFGIDDDGIIKGVDNPEEACLRLENKINDNLKPIPRYELDIRNDSTITLKVFESDFKPYLYKGKAYKRYDSSTIEVDRLELNRLILEGNNQSYEEITSKKQNLTFTYLEKELIDNLSIKGLNEDILRTLDLYTNESQYNNAAALLADKNDYKGVDIVRFGKDIDEIMDRNIIENMSILKMLKESVDMYKKYYQYEKIEGTTRTLVSRVPENAFREAIANALIHRVWDVNTYIKVSMFEDRIEIVSPGGLPSGLGKDEYLNGQISLLRNPIIGNLFFRLRYIEKFGTGIKRINKSYIDSITKPKYKVYDNSICIELPTLLVTQNLTEDEEFLVSLFQGNIKLSRTDLESKSGLGKAKIIRTINSLIEKNIIARSGKGRSTKYYIL